MGKIWTWDECTEATRAAARKAYEAYTANSGGLNYQGNPCPAWPDLPEAIRSHWCAATISFDRRLQDPTDDEHG